MSIVSVSAGPSSPVFLARHRLGLILILALAAALLMAASGAAIGTRPGASWQVVRFVEGSQVWETGAGEAECRAAQGEDGVICVGGPAS